MKRKLKQTEIGHIPEDWDVITLDETTEINKESRDPSNKPETRFYYIDIESVENGTGSILNVKRLIGKEAPSRARRVVHENDVIMSTVRPYLKAFAIIDKKYDDQISSTGFAVLTSKDKIHPKYLLYSLFSDGVISQCTKMMIGGQYPALNSSQVARIKIPLPSIREQQSISEVLSTVDARLDIVERESQRVERLKVGLMKELFDGKKWPLVKLSEIAENDEDIVAGPFGSNLKVSDYKEQGIPIIRLQNIDRNRFIFKDIKYISSQKAEELKYHSFIAGDIILAKLGDPIGKTCVVPEKLKRGIIVADVVRIRVSPKIADKLFVEYLLNSPICSNQLNREVIGTTRPRVNLSQVRNLSIPLPSLTEQRAIGLILSTIDKKLSLQQSKKTKLESIKKSLMNDLLTGKKRVKVTQ